MTSRNIEVKGKGKSNVRRNLFNEDDGRTADGIPLPLKQHDEEQYNEIRNNADDAGCSASSHEYSRNTKPAITSIDKVELDLNQVYKSSTGVDNRNKPKGDSNDAHEKKRKTADIQHPKVSRQRTRDAEGDGGNVQRLENEDQPLHANANDMIEADDGDNPGGDERVERERLPLQTKKRRREPTGAGIKGNTSREIEAMIQYYEDREEDGHNERKMYEVAGTKIHLGEGIEASAALWFLIQQKKPTIFFREMLELIWPKQKLLNRCLSEDKIITRLLNRSPMKELTPRKKRLAYKLYSDYLDSKKIKESEKMKFLSKVPALTTAKIQYLRTKFYK